MSWTTNCATSAIAVTLARTPAATAPRLSYSGVAWHKTAEISPLDKTSGISTYLNATRPGRAVMFHHDPAHSDDFLESMRSTLEEQADGEVDLAAEQASYEV